MVPSMLQSSDIPSRLAPKTPYEFHFFPTQATCHKHHNLIDLIPGIGWRGILLHTDFCLYQIAFQKPALYKGLSESHFQVDRLVGLMYITIFLFLNMFFLWVLL